MDLKGFDIYSFPARPQVLYAIREFLVKAADQRIRVMVELFVRGDCPRVLLSQGSAKAPEFLVRNSADGLMKPVASGLVRGVRKALYDKPAGDTFEGQVEAIADLGSVFGLIPLPAAHVSVRLPIVVSRFVEFESKTGARRNLNAAIFELKPQGFGYLVCTEDGLKSFIGELEKGLRA